jgi:hypothetical protein
VGLAPGDWAEWFAAVGTVGALVAALWQIATERNRRTRQEKEDRENDRRSQARLVACWLGEQTAGPFDPWWGNSTSLYLVNGSDEPVYNLVFALVHVQGAGYHHVEDWTQFTNGVPPISTASILVPGRWRVWVPGQEWGAGMGLRLGAEVAFTDRAGVHWIRRSNGELQELPEAPVTFLRLSGPYDWQTPESATQ